MSNFKYKAIWIPVLVILTIIFIALNVAANTYKQSLDTYLNHGTEIVKKKTDLSEKDAKFYNKRYKTTSSKNGSVGNALKVSKKVTDEGEVLMKNDGVLPLKQGSKVSAFGYRYLNPVYGGSGSGNIDSSKSYVMTAEKGLKKYYTVNSSTTDAMKNATPKEITSKGINNVKKSSTKGKGFSGASTSIVEYDPAIYNSVSNSTEGTVGIVYIGRVGGEGSNLQKTAYADGTKHELQLTQYEKDTLKFAKEHCKKVIVVVNSSNVMELNPITSGPLAADAIIWVGGPGATGFSSLADIMVGKVNPSGKTADIWDSDLTKNPTYQNFNNNQRFNNAKNVDIAAQVPKGLQYTEYQEGIYYGYRYYETASDLNQLDYKKSVTYPFGYGLSYTTFKQSIKSIQEDNNRVTFTVEVKNTGSRDGSDAIQLYYNPPYTDLDKNNNIQKSTKNLLAFNKVKVSAGKTVEKKITVNKQDMASYSYKHDNGDGTTGSYMLEAGNYEISLGKDSHDSFDKKNINVAKTSWFTDSNPRDSDINAQSAMDNNGNTLNKSSNKNKKYVAATNQFTDVTKYMEDNSNILSRSNWAGTQPQKATSKSLDKNLLKEATTFDPKNDKLLGDHKDSKVYTNKLAKANKKNNLTLSEFRGLNFNNSRWESLLDQLNYKAKDLDSLLYMSAFTKSALSAVDKPASQDHDGPQGWGLTGAKGGPDTCGYSSEVVVASTYNPTLSYEYGSAIGQEALTIGYTGWYGPAMNIHRSAFNGRNFEYYSEDPLLTGRMAERTISGASDQGVVCFMKHFVLDDSEENTSSMTVWATEQTIREIYLKAFEIPVKEAKMTIKYIPNKNGKIHTKTMRSTAAIMTSAALIGPTWSSANYPLMNNVVRNEWGYQGMFSTDMFLNHTKNITTKVFRAGNNAKMWFAPTSEKLNLNNPTDRSLVRNSMHYVLYTYVNSNLMQGVAPGNVMQLSMSPWNKWLIAADVIALIFILTMIFMIIYRTRKEKKSPDLFKKHIKK